MGGGRAGLCRGHPGRDVGLTGFRNRNIAYFAARTDIPLFYQMHAGECDYEVTGVRARVLPVTVFAGILVQFVKVARRRKAADGGAIRGRSRLLVQCAG